MTNAPVTAWTQNEPSGKQTGRRVKGVKVLGNFHDDYSTSSEFAQHANFRIDPEFQDKIPPIGDEEYALLREDILETGEVREPLIVWKEENILVDGHNRWKVIQEQPTIKWTTRQMSFPDKWAAFEWMYKNQLGRRNLTDEQRTYLMGKRYEARKNTEAFKGNQYTNKSGDGQNVHHQTKKEIKSGTAGVIGKDYGVDSKTVRRAEKFAHGVDVLREVNPAAADKVLNGKTKIPKSAVAEIARMEQKEVEAAADAILSDMAVSVKKPDPPKPEQPKKKPVGRPTEYREMREIIDKVVASQTDPDASPVFNLDDLISEIKVNGESYVMGLRDTISIRTNLLMDVNAKQRVFREIAAIIQNIVKVRGEFTT